MAFEIKPEHNDVLWAHQDTTESSSSRFFAMSTAAHVALLLATAFISAPLIQQATVETVTIEIESEPESIAKGQQVMATQGSSPTQVKVAATPSAPVVGGNELSGEDDIVVTKPQGRAAPVKASAPKQARASQAKAAPKAAPIKALAASIDDIDAPELDEALLEQTKTVKGFDDDLGSDFENIDRQSKAKAAAIAKAIDEDANQLAQENDEFLNSIAEQTNSQTAAFLAANKARRAQDYAGIAAAKANEEAAAAARAAALAKARQAELRNGSGAGFGSGSGNGVGQGAGNNGVNAPSQTIAGSPNGVRKLDQLRQMPGNPIPQYSLEEREKGHQGNVVFHAYVDRSGGLQKFKQVSSTGYANLDVKTLNALKRWKFYPGQEGWVELPFGWSLKGGAKAIGGTLRSRSAMR